METAVVENTNTAAQIQMRRRMAENIAREAQEKLQVASKELEHAKSVVKAVRAPMMHPSRMQPAEYNRQDFVANAEVAHTVDDLLQPGYWSHMAAQLNAYDHIEVRADDGSWLVELLVTEVGKNYAKVIIRHKYDLVNVTEAPVLSEQHKIEFKGPQKKHVVIRVSDGQSIKEGISKREEAEAWLKDYERTIAG